jgi:hypothetical protein
VIENAGRGGQNNVTELTSREKTGCPALEILETDVVAGVDGGAFVDTVVC